MEHKALSPLHFAAWFNAAKAVDVLLRNGANVESGSAFGQKPLHYAVSRASAELVMVSQICLLQQLNSSLFTC